MLERRKYKRLNICVPVRIKLMGTLASPPPIDAGAENVSLDGLSLVIKIKIKRKNTWLSVNEGEEPVKKIPYLLLKDKVLELGLKVLPRGGMIKARGKVMWYKRSLRGDFYHLRAGVFIDEIESEDREKWLEFLKTVAQTPNKYYLRGESQQDLLRRCGKISSPGL